ncbi:DUF6053 domain-containing protein [Lysobacter enzymogenes]|uniref:DUF6053 domain-containing protein n=1 Tax=Lysobacter enzymogenes TaxID=69 RepID=UPI0033987345
MGGTSVPTLLSQTEATSAESIGPEGPPTNAGAAATLAISQHPPEMGPAVPTSQVTQNR